MTPPPTSRPATASRRHRNAVRSGAGGRTGPRAPPLRERVPVRQPAEPPPAGCCAFPQPRRLPCRRNPGPFPAAPWLADMQLVAYRVRSALRISCTSGSSSMGYTLLKRTSPRPSRTSTARSLEPSFSRNTPQTWATAPCGQKSARRDVSGRAPPRSAARTHPYTSPGPASDTYTPASTPGGGRTEPPPCLASPPAKPLSHSGP
jgi:hypothetical protein